MYAPGHHNRNPFAQGAFPNPYANIGEHLRASGGSLYGVSTSMSPYQRYLYNIPDPQSFNPPKGPASGGGYLSNRLPKPGGGPPKPPNINVNTSIQGENYLPQSYTQRLMNQTHAEMAPTAQFAHQYAANQDNMASLSSGQAMGALTHDFGRAYNQQADAVAQIPLQHAMDRYGYQTDLQGMQAQDVQRKAQLALDRYYNDLDFYGGSLQNYLAGLQQQAQLMNYFG